ncbi:EamA-like transporter family protein [Psychrobacter pasteurii]|uniref:EamA-like transporter family protein n=2 Tax=Psychrobacter TaxID=497 RepID=A0A1R4EJ07_9GAMM|nr:EamA family transporter [Psychrobacter pasteurii]SJM38501.1 EamA-like transporter family protein [Psychrobacter pasteurii]
MHKKIIGISLVILFNILSGVQAVYLSGLLKEANVYATLCICFSFVTIVFILINVISNKPIKSSVKKNYANLVIINVTTLGNWLTFFIALKYIEPAMSSALANSIAPTVTLFATYFFLKGSFPKLSQLLVSLGIFLSMGIMIFVTIAGKSASGTTDISYLWLGVIASLICGVSIAFTNIVSKKLNISGINAKEIMMYRFVLLIIVCGVVAGSDVIIETLKTLLLPLLFISIIGNVIPLFSLQLSIEKLEPITVSLLLVLAPIFYLIIQVFDKNIPISPISWIAISISIVFVAIGTLTNLKVSKT